MYEGDLFIYPQVVLAKLLFIPMPTAIIRIYTDSGFVVAADGRTTDSATGLSTNDQLQKIYQMGNAPLAASFTGGARLGKIGSDSEILFDFISELTSAGQIVSSKRAHGLQEYATKIANLVQKKLETTMLGGNIELPSIPSSRPGDYGETIMMAFLDGYHQGRPDRVRVRFCHEKGKLLAPHSVTEPIDAGLPIITGFAEIANRLISNDPSLSRYMVDMDLDQTYSDDLSTAIKLSRAFIDACGGPEAALLDQKKAAAIGGHIHIASITPKRGFRWEKSPVAL